jgi:hypothetical protein
MEPIRAYVAENGITPPPRAGEAKPRAAKPAKPAAGTRAREVGAAFAAGETLEQLARRYGVTETTVLRNLQDCQAAGEALPPERLLAECLLSQADQTRVLALLREAGQDLLGPINAALGGAIPYRELHLLRLYHRCPTE